LRLAAAAPVRGPVARTAPEHAVSAVHWIAAVATLLLLAYLTCALLKPEWFE
jgi:K+-transporting ATPase KdpF subunit